MTTPVRVVTDGDAPIGYPTDTSPIDVRDIVATLAIIAGVVLLVVGVTFAWGWQYGLIVGGACLFLVGFMLAFDTASQDARSVDE